MKKYIAEFLGTFALVFCGTGAVVINQQTNGAVGQFGIAITFGLIVTAMIYLFGNRSGAHINPAVTLAFSVVNLFPKKQILPYIISQIIGAIVASVILKLLFPSNLNVGSTIPSGSYLQSFFLEIVLTFILMLVILFTSQGSKEKGTLVGVAIGSIVFLEALFAGPVSGASMNPARSIGPAVVSGNINVLWLYIAAPITGALSAAWLWKFFKAQ